MFHASLFHRFIPGGDRVTPPEPIEVKDNWEYIVKRLLQHH